MWMWLGLLLISWSKWIRGFSGFGYGWVGGSGCRFCTVVVVGVMFELE